MDSFYITVPESGNHLDDFRRFMDTTTNILNQDAAKRAGYYRARGGEKLEQDVLSIMQGVAPVFRFDPMLIKHTPKQHFPDIVSNNFFGVEVKSTQSNHWKSIGSSIVETLREEDVKKVFLMFGKLLANAPCGFKCRPYEDCLYDISITHSPRYQIDMDTPSDETIFKKIGEEYDKFRVDPHKIQVIRNYYREYYRMKGFMPWWIEDNDDDHDKTETKIDVSPNGIHFWNDLSLETKEFLRISMYQLFPEVLQSKSNKKYKNASLWLASRYFVINPSFRDIFSASGQGKIFVDGKLRYDKVPKALCSFIPYYQTVLNSFDEQNFSYDEIHIYSEYYKAGSDMKSEWKNKVRTYWDHYANNPISFDEMTSLSFIEQKAIPVANQKGKYDFGVMMKEI